MVCLRLSVLRCHRQHSRKFRINALENNAVALFQENLPAVASLALAHSQLSTRSEASLVQGDQGCFSRIRDITRYALRMLPALVLYATGYSASGAVN